MRSIGYTAVLTLVAAGLVLGGCGGGSSKSSSADPSSSASNTEPGASPTDPPDSDGKSSEIPTIADQTWTTGRIHVEVSGDKTATFESDGSGATLDGVTSAAFTQNPPNHVSLGLGGSEESAITLTGGGVSTVGGFSSNCSISFTKSDATGVAADFTCEDMDAVAPGTTDAFKIDVTGNFTLTP